MFKSFAGLSGFVNVITREPYRIFFPLGIFMGTLGIGHWLFYALRMILSVPAEDEFGKFHEKAVKKIPS